MKARTVAIVVGSPLAVVALLIASAWLAAAVFLLSVKKDVRAARPDGMLAYWTAYRDDPQLAKKMKGAITFSALLCFVGLPAGLVAAGRKRRPLHGAARFATPAEVAGAGLLTERGIILGTFRDRFLMLGGQLFAMLCAPTRSGKGVAVVIPNLLNWHDSVIVNDIKGEAFDVTAGFRARFGPVFVFDPFNEGGHTHGWNPLSYVRTGTIHCMGDLMMWGRVLYPHEDRANDSSNFFNDQALNLWVGVGLYLCETPGRPLTIGQLLRETSGYGKPLKEHLTQTLEERAKSAVPLSDACVDALNRFLSNPENTLGSILSTFNAPLLIFANPYVDASMSFNSFDLRDVRRRRMSIYLRVPPGRLEESALLFNLFWSQVVKLNTDRTPQQDASLKHMCLLLLDEFPALGKVHVLAKGAGYLAGYNLRFLTIAQSIAQLEDIYGEKGARALVTNHAAQIVFAPREQKDAEEYSRMLGFLTERAVSRGHSSSTSQKGGSSSSSTNSSDQRRALMLPQELKEMGHGRCIVLLENVKPIMADRLRYYDNPIFQKRLFPPPAVPRLDMALYAARAEGRRRRVKDEDFADGAQLLGRLAHKIDALPHLSPDATQEEMSEYLEAFFATLDLEDSATPLDTVPAAAAGADASAAGRQIERDVALGYTN